MKPKEESKIVRFVRADADDENAVCGYIKICGENKDILEKYRNRENYTDLIEFGNVDARNDIFAGIEQADVKARIIVVGSVSKESGDIKASGFSCYGERVDIVAPGDEIR